MATLSNYSSNTLPAEGRHPGRIATYIELGIVETKFGGSYQAAVTIELCEPTRKAGKPVLAYKTIFNVSMRSPNFRDLIKAVTNRAELGSFDTKDLIGRPCEVSIIHRVSEHGIFADAQVSRYTGTAELPPLMSEPIFFSLHHSDFDADVLDSLPEKLRDKIKRGRTYQDLMHQRSMARMSSADVIDDGFPDNLPF